MIKINDIEILTVGDGLIWSGSKDTVARTLSFNFLYVPQDKSMPAYKVKCGDKVRYIEDNKTLFYGYVESMDYATDDKSININCIDLSSRLLKSKCIGRFKGTFNQLANNICGTFELKNGINIDNTHVHNIVSTGDLSYYDILNTACSTMFTRYKLYLDGTTLKLAEDKPINTFQIGKNIRSSSFSQNLSEIVNKVLIIDNEGKIQGSVQNTEDINAYGLFQDVYTYGKDIKNNTDEAKKLLKSVQNEARIIVENDNNCISGRRIEVIEPINNFQGIFEIQTDTHNIGVDKNMELEIKSVSSV